MMNATENFSPYEFACPCCGANDMDDSFIETLQELRSIIGKPFKINSGYRCEDHNASQKVGGAPNSQHLFGFAADISTVNFTSEDRYRLIAEAMNHSLGGIGISDDFIHLDARITKPKMWVY